MNGPVRSLSYLFALVTVFCLGRVGALLLRRADTTVKTVVADSKKLSLTLADGESLSTRRVKAPADALAFLSLADGESPSSYGVKTPQHAHSFAR